MIYALLQTGVTQSFAESGTFKVLLLFIGGMMSLTMTGVGVLVKLNFTQRDDIRDLKRIVGLNGSAAGLQADNIENKKRLAALELRQATDDAVTRTEEKLMQEINRRPERFRDHVRSYLALSPEDESLMGRVRDRSDASRDSMRVALGDSTKKRRS